VSLSVYALVVGAWSLLRVAELLLSEVNTGPLLGRGAREVGASHHIWLLLMNAAVPMACVAEVVLRNLTFLGLVGWVALVALVLSEALHWWAIVTLWRRWTTRVLVLPHEQPTSAGPYRWLRHPGYVGGVVSALALPMVVGAIWALLLTVAMYTPVVTLRVRAEDEAWARWGAS
jgi:methyltransferase